jgi:hypothetical protein
MLRIPHCLDNWLTDGGKFVSPTHKPSLWQLAAIALSFQRKKGNVTEMTSLFLYVQAYGLPISTKTPKQEISVWKSWTSIRNLSLKGKKLTRLFSHRS